MTWLHAFVDVPTDLHEATASFWSGALGWPLSEPLPGHPELRSFRPPSGAAYVHLQSVDDQPRVHLDVEAHDRGAVVGRALDLGAGLVARHDEWTTLSSPGGLPFCVVPAELREAPAPEGWPGGHRSMLTQLCLDSPASRHDDEVRFWRELLAGEWWTSESPEFDGPLRPESSPLQLLFQRRDDDEGATRTHLDLASDDVAAEVARLLALGAEDLGPGRTWHVLRDPAGLELCVTTQSPDGAPSLS